MLGIISLRKESRYVSVVIQNFLDCPNPLYAVRRTDSRARSLIKRQTNRLSRRRTHTPWQTTSRRHRRILLLSPIDIQFERRCRLLNGASWSYNGPPTTAQEGFYHRWFSFITIFINNFTNCPVCRINWPRLGTVQRTFPSFKVCCTYAIIKI